MSSSSSKKTQDNKVSKESVEAPEEIVASPRKSADHLQAVHALDAFKPIVKMDKPGTLVSRLPNPVLISYEGRGLVIPPRAAGKTAVKVENRDKLGALPRGVMCVEVETARRKRK